MNKVIFRNICLFGLCLFICCQIRALAQEPYEYPKDPLVRQKLETWMDAKFGLLMHFGLYSQLGIVESWGLCSEDQPFQDRGGMPYTEFKEMYFGLIEKFNPQQFDPVPWAEATRAAGMKYVVFTTKHHDGFCMFDTQQTDFKITGDRSPFKNHPKSNITKEVFKAFREQDFMIGAYYSKPDWHHSDYWSPLWATSDRNNNYDIRKYPEKWDRFKEFVYNQIEELTMDYGSVDILWLDGGWVRPKSTVTEEVRAWGMTIPEWDQDIGIPGIGKMARMNQPGLLIVDRTVHGPFENYRTPEQRVPDGVLPFPWETNLTMTQDWGHSFNPVYKSSRELIHTMIDVVSKGGNFLLGIGPTPDGTFEQDAYDRLSDIGEWMDVNGEAIYGSRPWSTFHEGNHIRFTSSKDRRILYAICTEWPGKMLVLSSVKSLKASKITLLGTSDSLIWNKTAMGWVIDIPLEYKKSQNRPCQHAWVFRIEVSGS